MVWCGEFGPKNRAIFLSAESVDGLEWGYELGIQLVHALKLLEHFVVGIESSYASKLEVLRHGVV